MKLSYFITIMHFHQISFKPSDIGNTKIASRRCHIGAANRITSAKLAPWSEDILWWANSQ